MSSVDGIGSGNSNLSWLQQKLFGEIDSTGSGSITKASLEKAVTSAGGNVGAADALFAQLDPGNTGSVNAQQFAQNLPLTPLSQQMGAQMMGYQANGWPGSFGGGLASAAQSLFNQIDTTGSGSITKASLEQAVTTAGGTTAAADALYARLDPTNSGSVSEQQFTQALAPAHGHHHHGHGGPSGGAVGALASLLTAANGADGTTATTSEDQIAQNLFNQIDTTGSGSITKASLEQAVTAAGGTAASADALYARLDPTNTGSVNEQQFAQVLTQPVGDVGQASVPMAGSAGDSDGDADTGSGSSTGGGSSAGSALASLMAALGPTNTGNTGTSTGSTPADALLALLEGASSGAGTSGWSPLGPSTLDFATAISQYQGNQA